jgi:trans-aconitate methyltransferase
MKDTTFFNQESTQYSKKRYTGKSTSYLQAFFNHRLKITESYLRRVSSRMNNPSVLEIGCADGVIIRDMAQKFPKSSEFVGIDIAPEMIDAARRQNTDARVSFFIRNQYVQKPVDLVVETGVVNYSIVDDEIRFAHEQLKEGGWYVLSIAGAGSLYNRIKHDMLQDLRAYKEYSKIIDNYFDVRAVEGVGFFIPLIWKVPTLARPMQALFEAVMGRLAPGLCHEKMYLLQKK